MLKVPTPPTFTSTHAGLASGSSPSTEKLASHSAAPDLLIGFESAPNIADAAQGSGLTRLDMNGGVSCCRNVDEYYLNFGQQFDIKPHLSQILCALFWRCREIQEDGVKAADIIRSNEDNMTGRFVFSSSVRHNNGYCYDVGGRRSKGAALPIGLLRLFETGQVNSLHIRLLCSIREVQSSVPFTFKQRTARKKK